MKKRISFISALLCIVLLISSFTVYAGEGADGTETSEAGGNGNYGCLTEEAVIAALANTFNDSQMLKAINRQRSFSPNNVQIKTFSSLDYSRYTEDQFGGMYVEDNGTLVLCYIENSDMLDYMKTHVQDESFRLLSSDSNTALVDSVKIKGVKYSYTDLNNAMDLLSQHKYEGHSSLALRLTNNRIEAGIKPGRVGEISKNAIIKDLIAAGFDANIVVFVENDEEYQVCVDINGTSQIINATRNLNASVAGQMFSDSKGYYGVISCGHGMSKNDVIKKGSATIGKIIGTYNNASNDSSFIKLNSGHSYTGSKVDELSSTVPAEGDKITLRGGVSGSISAKVLSNKFNESIKQLDGSSIDGKDMIQVNKPLSPGDSGGGAIGRIIDGGRTNEIIGINRASNSTRSILIKGSYVIDSY